MIWLEQLATDVRYAWRSLLRMPMLASVVIVSLGVGIGVNTAIFSWIQAVILQPLPGVRGSSSLVFVEPRGERGSFPGSSWLEYRDLIGELSGFEQLVASRMMPFNVGVGTSAERTYGQLVSANFFSGLELAPVRGRFFAPDEVSQPGGASVVVVSHAYWQGHLAGAANVVGRPIVVNDRELTIIGVAPPRFQGSILGLDFDLWLPATLAPVLFSGSRELEDRSARGYAVMGRLRAGVTRSDAEIEVQRVMRELARAYPASNATIDGVVLPFSRAPRGPQGFLLPALAALQGVMLLVLLAVCANTANLILARASTRQREVGVRRALGAGRGRVLRLLLTESLVLAVLGATLGVAIAVWGSSALRAVPMIATFPIRFQTGVDGLGLAFAMTLGIACGLAFGLTPAWQLATVLPQAALRSGARTMGRSRLRNALMGVEVGLALLVLVAAGMFLRRFSETRDLDPGFRTDVQLAAYDFAGRPVSGNDAREFAARLLAALAAHPSVEAAGIAMSVPLDIHGLPVRAFALEGRARATTGEDQALSNIVTPGYFAALGIPLIAGRDLADLRDGDATAQVVVNEEFVRAYLDGSEPLGRRIESRADTFEIAGVVRNSLYDAFGETPRPIIYYSYRDRPMATGEIHVRGRPGTQLTLPAEIRRILRQLDPTIAPYDVRTMGEHIDRNLLFRRIPARIFSVLGPMLLVLAAIGIYAVISYGVARRASEMGVRLALGATARTIVTQVIRENLRVIGIGMLVGWVVAYLVYIHVEQGKPLDLPVFLGVPAVLLLVALAASWLPARRAGRIDPLVALRQE
jgi:predicted permease